MRIQQLLEHHGIARNPFAEEDAQTDPVFKDFCIASAYHPAWDKVYGDPADPATAVVFGEKGAGKTAMRLQIESHLDDYNRQHPEKRIYVIEYDDFNPFLDRFRDRLRHKRADKVLAHWRLWDHMDAILTLGVTALADRLLEVKQPSGSRVNQLDNDFGSLDRHQSRDLLLLAACYDQSTAETYKGRWHRLRKRLKFHTWKSQLDMALGIGVTVATVVLMIWLAATGHAAWLKHFYLYLLLILAGWAPRLWRMWRTFRLAWGVVRHQRVGNLAVNPLRRVLAHFSSAEITSQPLPNKDRTDDRFELLDKFQGILKSLGYSGVIVLVDRVDEPHLINGSAELMKQLLWPMLDNKFLKHPGMGLKLMLPVELTRFIDREDRDFYQRARLDKQNMIPSLEWTGEALFDVANARIRACAVRGEEPSLRSLFGDSISDPQLIEAFRSLRVPRHLFKFMYRLMSSHANAHTESEEAWQIERPLFESELALYRREQDAADHGQGPG